MRVLYLYPEEWTGRRAREVHTLSTCLALARNGWEMTLLTAGGEAKLRNHLAEVSYGIKTGLRLATLSRSFGPVRSARLFALRMPAWLRDQAPFDAGFTIHLKAAAMFRKAGLPYLYEAHEIFAETPTRLFSLTPSPAPLERATIAGARMRVVTSLALGDALRARYHLPDDLIIAPNAGDPPLAQSVADANGPFVYAGSLAGWKGLELAIEAARAAGVPLRVVGGSEAEWQSVGTRCDTRGVEWRPRVPLSQIPDALAGARAGLVPTLPEPGSGHYSCPMKLFDYARCGLPVISMELPALRGLQTEKWCTTVFRPTVGAWSDAMRNFALSSEAMEATQRWSAMHTWDHRARLLVTAWANLPPR